ncbi:MAG: helix-turn-helix domain-containing protein [Actinomycetia bacterium]|nr:helix-turn-helix domain-containing protein [Actinomycetes bacterium]
MLSRRTTQLAYPVAQAAQLAGLGTRTLQRATASGELPAYKVGTRTRIMHGDLIAWLTARPVRPGPGRDLTHTLSGAAEAGAA